MEVLHMDMVTIQELAFKHLANRKAHNEREKGFIYYHGQRVANIAIELRKLILPDNQEHDQELLVAAYFHDIAKGIEPHSQYGAILVAEILKDHCNTQELSFITELVRYHQIRDKTKNYHDFIKILQDADVLDHVGVVEIWMNFQYNAHTGGTLDDALSYYKGEYVDLAKSMRNVLNYSVSQDIFDEKQQFLSDFIARLAVEAKGNIFLD